MTDVRRTPAVVCLSHLGWNSIWQRPHHIMSRLACRTPVLYVNEPELIGEDGAEPYLRHVGTTARLTAWQPMFPERPHVFERWRSYYVQLVLDLLLHHKWVEGVDGGWRSTRPLALWFYTPTPVYVLDHVPADVVVYDVMDDLASFKGAARDLPKREDRLLSHADVVFAGGRSLYEARRDRHSSLHLFPSGVEPTHFAQARRASTDIAAEIADLSGPVLGYYGAIDERIDLTLLDTLAAENPEWNVIMVGPVVKIEPEALPRHPNLQYVGRQPYERLPNFLRGFDVCLMPFALNEATRSISPTKTLEYMAARKPIVSTPIPDVVANWGDAVYIAETPEAFRNAVRRALAETDEQQEIREERQVAHVGENGWDDIAEEMFDCMLSHLNENAGVRYQVSGVT